MLQDSWECNPNTVSLLQPKVLEAIDYILYINKQCHDFDAIYKHMSKSEALNIDKIIVANIIDALIDRNVTENRKLCQVKYIFIFTKKATKPLELLLKKLVMKLICLPLPTTSLQLHRTLRKH